MGSILGKTQGGYAENKRLRCKGHPPELDRKVSLEKEKSLINGDQKGRQGKPNTVEGKIMAKVSYGVVKCHVEYRNEMEEDSFQQTPQSLLLLSTRNSQ
jgi:hypothetical protein